MQRNFKSLNLLKFMLGLVTSLWDLVTWLLSKTIRLIMRITFAKLIENPYILEKVIMRKKMWCTYFLNFIFDLELWLDHGHRDLRFVCVTTSHNVDHLLKFTENTFILLLTMSFDLEFGPGFSCATERLTMPITLFWHWKVTLTLDLGTSSCARHSLSHRANRLYSIG